MIHPNMDYLQTSRRVIDEFRGINEHARIGDGEFADDCNVSSCMYPVLSYGPYHNKVRNRNRTILSMTSNEGLVWIEQPAPNEEDQSPIIYQDCILTRRFRPALDPTVHKYTMASMGSEIIIPESAAAYDTVNTETVNGVERHILRDLNNVHSTANYPPNTTLSNVFVTFAHFTTFDGQEFGNNVSDDPPANPSDGEYWVDTSRTDIAVGKQYKESDGKWHKVDMFYTLELPEGFKEGLHIGDEIEITYVGVGPDTPGYNMNGKHYVRNIITSPGKFIDLKHNYDHIVIDVVPGVFINGMHRNTVIVSRKIPTFSCFCVSGNRAWGGSPDGHTIYASALGDPTSWWTFEGTAADAYQVTIAADGPFTGCIEHAGQVWFFKEDCIITISGTKPANYQVTTYNYPGVGAGCERSLCEIDGVLYYRGASYYYAIANSYPQIISQQLMVPDEKNGIWASGEYDGCYYTAGRYTNVFEVYDTRLGVWHRKTFRGAEGVPSIVCMAEHDRMLFYTVSNSSDSNTEVFCIGNDTNRSKLSSTAFQEGIVLPWFIESGDIGLAYTATGGDSINAANKYVTDINIRIKPDADAVMIKTPDKTQYTYTPYLRVLIRYTDCDGPDAEWKEVFFQESPGDFIRKVIIPVQPRRHDTMRMRIEGHGYFTLYSITKTIEEGSDTR